MNTCHPVGFMRIKQGLMTRVSEPHGGMEVSPPPRGFKLIIASWFSCLPTHNPIIHQVTRLLCRKESTTQAC